MVCMESGQDVAQGEFEHRPFYWPGSGDFVLTSRRWVLAVHGYPEAGCDGWDDSDVPNHMYPGHEDGRVLSLALVLRKLLF